MNLKELIAQLAMQQSSIISTEESLADIDPFSDLEKIKRRLKIETSCEPID